MASHETCPFLEEVKAFARRTKAPRIRETLSDDMVLSVARAAPAAAMRLAKAHRPGAAANERDSWKHIYAATKRASNAVDELIALLDENGFARFNALGSRAFFIPTPSEQKTLIATTKVRSQPPPDVPTISQLETFACSMRAATNFAERQRLWIAQNVHNEPDHRKDSYSFVCLDLYVWMTGVLPGISTDTNRSPFLRLLQALWDSDSTHSDGSDFVSTVRRLPNSTEWYGHNERIRDPSKIGHYLRSGPVWWRGDEPPA